MHTTSVSLLKRLHQPEDQLAWARFVDLYTPLLFHWARRTGLPEADAADLIQDVFGVLVRKLPEFAYDEQRSFRGWLRTVLLNQWRTRLRAVSCLENVTTGRQVPHVAAGAPGPWPGKLR